MRVGRNVWWPSGTHPITHPRLHQRKPQRKVTLRCLHTHTHVHSWLVLPGPHLPWSLLGCKQETGLCWRSICGPPNSVPEQTGEGPREKNYLTCVFALQRQSCTKHVLCDFNRHFSYRGIFAIFIREARDSLLYLDIRFYLWAHAHTQGEGGMERESLFLFDPSHIHLPFFPPSLPLTCN